MKFMSKPSLTDSFLLISSAIPASFWFASYILTSTSFARLKIGFRPNSLSYLSIEIGSIAISPNSRPRIVSTMTLSPSWNMSSVSTPKK